MIEIGDKTKAVRVPAEAGIKTAPLADGHNLTANAIQFAASALGIPEQEFTPKVRAAVLSLMERSERLRREVDALNARLNDVARNADQDVLLPVLNRRAFVREITRFVAFVERYGTPSCLLFFDLDEFKSVNDLYGHAAGDWVLTHFTKIISGHTRDSDIVARLGGDEFGVVLAHVTLDQAAKKGMLLERALQDSPALWKGHVIPLRFSYGVYELHAGDSADAAIAQADRAMYARKRGAR